MSRANDVVENPVTGERAVVRVGSEESAGEVVVADLYVRPGGAVIGEHVHPKVEERLTVVRGRIGSWINGLYTVTGAGDRKLIPPGAAHVWWNVGEEEAHVVVEVRPAARFEEMLLNLFGLAHDGKTNDAGMPNLLQAALFAREFSDVLYFTRPPRTVQKVLFGLLCPLAEALGYRASYPEYLERSSSEKVGASGRENAETSRSSLA